MKIFRKMRQNFISPFLLLIALISVISGMMTGCGGDSGGNTESAGTIVVTSESSGAAFSEESNQYAADQAGKETNTENTAAIDSVSEHGSQAGTAAEQKNSGKIGLTFAEYEGVDYKNQTDNGYVVKMLTYCQKMATVLWTAPFDFETWYHRTGAYCMTVSEDGTVSDKYLEGKQYRGIPYSLFNNVNTPQTWNQVLDADGLTRECMVALYDGREEVTLMYGIDCSHLLYNAIRYSGVDCPEYKYETTTDLKESDFYIACEWEQLEPGGILVNSNHVLIFAGMTADGKYACFESVAGLKSVSGCRYREYSLSELTERKYPFKPYLFKAFCDSEP